MPSPIIVDYYEINLKMQYLLGIDRAIGTFCIKENEGKHYLGSIDLPQLIDYYNTLNRMQGSEEDKLEYKCKIFHQLDPELNLTVLLDYPLGTEYRFAIAPYPHVHRDRTFPYYPVGYVAWRIAKIYEKLYQYPDEYGIFDHALHDLVLQSLVLFEGNYLRIVIANSLPKSL